MPATAKPRVAGAIQFILGRSGTGKTRYCINAIVSALLDCSDISALIFLVPEQATYQAERAILSDSRVAGYNRLHVVSFDRLQYLLGGKRSARPAVSRIGRAMIIQRILLDSNEKLKVFKSPAGPGLARQMAETIVEMQQYGRIPEDLEQTLEQLRKSGEFNLAAQKFEDIALVYDQYQRSIKDTRTDPDMQLAAACKQVAESDLLRGAKLWVDGFAGFTGGELAMLTELLRTAARTQIALCLDPATLDLKRPDAQNIDPAGLFYPTERTYAELVERIRKCKIPFAEPIVLDKPVRFAASKALAHIEQKIFVNRPSRMPAGGSVRVICAANPRAEAAFAAKEIVRLVRERALRYRDIAVVASDIDLYEHYIRAYFEDYHIPVFIDRRKRLNQHPLVELVCSAIQTIADGFASSDVFAYLKSDLVPVERSDADLLENYCIAFGITASDWTSKGKWTYAGDRAEQFGEGRVNVIRRRVIEPLLELQHNLQSQDAAGLITAGQFTKAIFGLLDGLKVREQLAEWSDLAVSQGDFAAADENRQLYERLVDVFDELVEVFAGRAMKCDDFLAIINSAFSSIALAFIPPNLDQVLVGSIERSRHPDLKVVFLVGVTQKQFPAPVSAAGVLTDDDRAAAESSGLILAPQSRDQLAARQYLAYIAFTRPSQLLYVTWSAVDDKGTPVACSQFVDNLREVFEDLSEEPVVAGQSIERILNEYELEDLLCAQLGRDSRPRQTVQNADFAGLLDEVRLDSELAELGERVVRAVNYDNDARLEKKAVQQLFAGDLRTSVSRLTTFAACPYQHFAHYVLSLEKREEFKLEPIDLGIFYHCVLDAVTKTINKRKLDFGAIADEDLLQILDEQVEKITAEDSFISSFARHSRHNSFIIVSAGEAIADCVLAVAQMVRAGRFRPMLSEASFGRARNATETIGDFVIDLPQGRKLLLNGKIDRIDIAQIDGRKVAIVFDYKKSTYTASFPWSDFVHGLEIQLPVYMLAVRSVGTIADETAGAFYIPIEVGAEQVSLDKYPPEQAKFTHKARGIFDGSFFRDLDSTIEAGRSKFYNFAVTAKDQQYGYFGTSGVLKPADFEAALAYVGRKIVELAAQISSGLIEARPYRMGNKSPCGRCDYKALCRFDWQINAYRRLEQLDKQDALGVIGAGNAGKRD